MASGPSAKTAGVDRLRDRVRVIAVNDGYDLCPWADAVYACDGKWWRKRGGLPEFRGVKIAWEGEPSQPAAGYRDLTFISVNKLSDKLQMDELGKVGSGGNSGFQAFNLVIQLGARFISLVGFDCFGTHFFGRHRELDNPTEENFKRWRKAFDEAASELSGVKVLNLSAESKIRGFHKATVEEVLRDQDIRWNAGQQRGPRVSGGAQSLPEEACQ